MWDFFGLETDDNGKIREETVSIPSCRTCGKKISAKGGNTTNLLAHLRDNHPTLYVQADMKVARRSSTQDNTTEVPQLQLTLPQAIERSKAFSPDSSAAREINHAVAYFIAKEMQPLSMVDKPGFRHMVHKLNPRYQMPSRKHFTEYEIPRMYNEVKASFQSKVKSVNYYSATTDLWTSAANIPFMSYTIHFVDADWNLKTYCLGTLHLSEDHTGDNIASVIQELLAEWKLNPDNLVATTTDNGSNMVAAAFVKLNWPRLSCFGHNLHLTIGKGLNDNRISRVLGKCCSLVAYFHRSWKKNRDLQHKQEELDLPQHKLISPVTTRWESTNEMISRIVEQQQAISAVLAGDRSKWHLMPSNDDFKLLETLVDVLKPLGILTDALSGEKQVTSSAIIPILKHLKENILKD